MTPPNQIHDFSPGIAPSGLFWTIPFKSSAVDVQLGAGRASFSVQDSMERDFHDIVNSLSGGPSKPAVASWDVEWSGATDHGHLSNSANTFELDFVDTGASISFSFKNETSGATFVSSSAGQTVKFARVAHERNGRFFNSGE